jgi:hypothetical protein
MAEGPDFLTSDTTEDVLIRTTFDPAMQAAAEAALEEIFATQVREGSEAQAAIVVMSADGAVRAMVGGRDTQGAGLFNRATQAMRQTGSAFKPFVYATALDLGWRFDDMILDAPLTIDVPGSGPYSPNELLERVLWRRDADRRAGAVAEHPCGAPVRECRAATLCGPWPPSSGSKAIWPTVRRWRWGVGIDPARNDRRLFRHPQRRLRRAALRPAGGAHRRRRSSAVWSSARAAGSRDLGRCGAALTYMMSRAVDRRHRAARRPAGA